MPLIQLPMWQRRTSLQYSGQDAACLSTRGTKAGPNNEFYPLMKHGHCFVATQWEPAETKDARFRLLKKKIRNHAHV